MWFSRPLEIGVLVRVKIYPEGKVDEIKEEIKKLKPESMKVEPIAFGLEALDTQFIIEDVAGGTDELEKKLNDIKGVRRVEVVGITRTL